jgi:thiamine-monophosphate kinase
MTAEFDPDNAQEWLAQMFPPIGNVIAGVGADDCGVIKMGHSYLVISTDFINARPISVEFGLADRSALGRLVVGHNLSDLCGSGATPIALLVGVMAERGSKAEEIEAVMRGVQEASSAWSVPVIGGDTKIGRSWAIYGVAVGTAPDADALFLKTRALAGDGIWVSGTIGDCCGSLLAHLDDPADADTRAWAIATAAHPVPPIELSARLSKARLARSGTDLSDGLLADLGDLCRASGVGAVIDADCIPVSPRLRAYAAVKGIPAWAYGLVLGGDLQFIVTAPENHASALRAAGMCRIGQITAGNGLALRSEGVARRIPELGHRDVRNLSFADEARTLLEIVRTHVDSPVVF